MKIKCLLLDTDLESVSLLAKAIKQHYVFELTNEFSNPLEAKKILNVEQVDIVFLDTDLGMFNAFEFLSTLKYVPYFVLLSSTEDSAFQAFEHDAVDYLLKPFSEERLKKCLDKCIKIMKSNYEEENENEEYLLVKHEGKSIKLALSKISYIKAFGDYCRINMTNYDSYLILTTLSKIAKKLPNDIFQRAQRSYIVNLKRITKLNSRSVFINEYEIPLGRQVTKQIREAYNKLF